MNNETKNKFAAILAAAQAKVTPTPAETKKQPQTAAKQPETIQDYKALPEIEQAAKNGEVISLLNLCDLVKKQPEKKPEPVQETAKIPELSNLTFADIIGENAKPTEIKQTFKILQYSPRSFAIVTDKKPAEDILNIFRLHGTYNPHLKCGKGWIFSNRHLNTIKAKLSL